MNGEKGKYEVRSFYKGQMIFKEGQRAETAFLVKSGTVEIFRIINNKRVVLAHLKEGKIFGEMGVITGGPRTASAMASEYSEMVVIDQKVLNHFLKKSPPIVHSLTRSLIERLQDTTKKVPEEYSSNVFMSVCNIIETLDTARRNMPASEIRQNRELQLGLNYRDLSRKIKEIILISQTEIDTIIKKLRSINVLDIESKSDGNGREHFVKITDSENFIKKAKDFYEEWKAIIPFFTSDQEFIDLYDFAKLVNSTPEMIYKKIGAGEIPENIFFVNKSAVSAWVKEVGDDFFKKVKRKRVKIEDIEGVDDIIHVDNASLQEVFSQIGYYKLGVLVSIANDKARDKIYQNISSNIANIIKEEMPPKEEIDEIEAAEIEGELINIIKTLKVQGGGGSK